MDRQHMFALPSQAFVDSKLTVPLLEFVVDWVDHG